ncbi:vWA domain-containing protein [Pseudaestuariivita atlantica]|uniref:VWFA domain-containing protein n=1 Tax=Pseudaestuariivita atlantica TaxID=1317121 RepID=A0A0L1JKX3_9RHOB|nr:VWA domain-containing protein [Pseudaestuariivita atlantica]KNG92401.1 hypothetical protein ATO11_17480 [Pseudaestuariivita atlantica]
MLAGLLACGATAAGASFTPCATDAMLVFDGSASMAERGDAARGEARIVDARAAMRRALPLITVLRRVGLVVYGPNGTPGDGPGASPMESVGCRSVDVRFGPETDTASRMIGEIDALVPGGSTPLTAAVSEAAEALDHTRAPGIVVLVTDGRETCGGTPCALAETLRADSADLVVHVVGFRVRADYFDWESGEGGDHVQAETPARCLADRTGGTYTATETVEELVAAMDATLGCALIGRGLGEDHPTYMTGPRNVG